MCHPLAVAGEAGDDRAICLGAYRIMSIAHPSIAAAIAARRRAVRSSLLPALLILAGSAATAKAQWQVVATGDESARHDGRRAAMALARSKAEDATLRFACANGAPLLTVEIGRDLARGMLDSTITFDNHKPQQVLLQVFSNPRSVPLFDISLGDVARAKRLRLELKPIDASPLAYDFDTRGGRKAMAAVVCGPRKRSLLQRLVR